MKAVEPTSKTHLAYWREQLSGGPAALQLPTDHPRPLVPSFRGASEPVHIHPSLSAALMQFSQREGCTLFMTLLACFQVVLSRWSGQEDVMVGSPIEGRTHPQLEGVMGLFVNNLVLRGRVSAQLSFRQFLQQVRETALGAYAHQDIPFEKLVAELQPQRDLSRQLLFQVSFTLQKPPLANARLSGLQLRDVSAARSSSKLDLSLYLFESEQGLHGHIEYATDLFEANTMRRMSGHLSRVMEAVVEDADRTLWQLPLLQEEERERLLVKWNATRREYSHPRCVQELFSEQAARTPDAPALVHQGGQLSYRELEERSNQLAHYLRSLGVGPEVVVGLCVERSAWMIIGVLGIMKAGGAYLPLDPQYPYERLAMMAEDADAAAVLTQTSLLERTGLLLAPAVCLDVISATIDVQNSEAVAEVPNPLQLAYVYYTSGSTGRPKGIAMAHSVLSNLILWQLSVARPPSRNVLQFTSISFDVSLQEIFFTLTSGRRLVLVGDEVRQDPRRLVEFIISNDIEEISAPQVVLTQIAREVQERDIRNLPLKCFYQGGEALHFTASIRQLFVERSSGAQLINHYGPTEAHVITFHEVDAKAEVYARFMPLGKPIANARLYVLDEWMQPVPQGARGVLYVGGEVLARGYLCRPGLSAERFVADPFTGPGCRMYCTGDLVRHDANGNLEFLGRVDEQVKIDGCRIEIGEVENVLANCEGVQHGVVVATVAPGGARRLIAYVTGKAVEAQVVRSQLQRRLPRAMVPASIIVLERMPLMSNGKIDRRSLPSGPAASGSQHAPPSSPLQQALVKIWADVLNLEEVGIHDGFFEVGGNSLMATRAIRRVCEMLGMDVPLRQIFDAPTVASFSENLLAEIARGG